MQTALIALELVARLNRISIDIRAIIREYGLTDQELTKEEFLRIVRNSGFKAKIKTVSPETLIAKYPLPAIAVLRDGRFAVLLKADGTAKKALLFVPAEKSPRQIGFAEFPALFSGDFIVLRHRLIVPDTAFGFAWFYREILRYRKVIGEVLTGSFVVQCFGLVTPLFTQVILDKVIVHRSMTTLDVLAVAFVAVTVFEFLLNVTRNYIFIHTANKLDAKLGAKLFRHLMSLPFVYFESRKVGVIAARVRELDNIREFITNKSVSLIIDLVFSLVFVIIMFLYSTSLSLIFLAFVALVAFLYLLVTPELRKRLEHKFQTGAQANSYLVESVTGIQTVKSLAIEGSMQKKWEDNLGNYVRSSFRLANMSNISGAISGTFQRLMTITVLYLGVRLVIENQLTIGQLIAFQMFAGQFSGPFLRLVGLWNEFQQALLSVNRLGDILNNPVEIQSGRDITLPRLSGDVRFDNVSFRYAPNAPYALRAVSFHIRPGLCVGIVGRSGSGKSTVTKLIQRLYMTAEGSITIDGVDIRQMNPFWLRYHIGVVLQEDYLFSGTIRENIALPRPDAPAELVIEAAKLAGAHEFVSALPEGYDTPVGERGATLSGGQKQRIAIARALITNPRIMIFDEATSSLDYESERIIRRNIRQIRSGRTMFIVAHRLAVVRDCDLIIVLDRGGIVETGTHGELMQKAGYYHHLFHQQEAGVDE
ncbi:MAG TPA: type I secretion system permease/ATPase [Syntrophales bacterium]|nr:type I secretion system permease/ATPase [Syntrophales bacterium]